MTVDRGVAAADDEMARLQLPIWQSADLKAALDSFAENDIDTLTSERGR